MIRTDISDNLLKNFEKRMKQINIGRSFYVTKCPEYISTMFKDEQGLEILNNIIVFVLLFIQECTLSNVTECTHADISEFIKNIIPLLPESVKITDPGLLANYIIVNVLQNKGRMKDFYTYYQKEHGFKNMSIRLIDEKNSSYMLTDDTFDFFYRGNEIDSQLEYSITRFKLQEYMKRKNYGEAYSQSRELLQRLRNMNNHMDSFIQRCKENIHKIDEDEFTEISQRYHNLIEEEQKQLSDIRKNAKNEVKLMKEAAENGVDNEDYRRNKQALEGVINNLDVVLNEQRGVINKRAAMNQSYRDILKNSYSISVVEHMNFDEDIIQKMYKMNYEGIIRLTSELLSLCTVPKMNKLFNIESLYDTISYFDDTAVKETGIDTSDLKHLKDPAYEKYRQSMWAEIFEAFFDFASSHQSFHIDEFISFTPKAKLDEWSQENMFADFFANLYSIEEIDLSEIKQCPVYESSGEFDLVWGLNQVPEPLKEMKKIIIRKETDVVEYEAELKEIRVKYEITNLKMEVLYE